MSNYKYSLDRTSKKFQCPNCSKRTLVRYIDNISFNYLEPYIGRCDRESKCGYHQNPKGNMPLVNISEFPTKIIRPSFHDDRVIKDFANNYENNNFVKYLKTKFDRVDVIAAVKRYFICTSNHWNGATIFWQIDELMRIKAGKVMLYEAHTGSRVKQPYSHINWMHKVLKSSSFDSDCSQGLQYKSESNTDVTHNSAFVLRQCLFGLHLLIDNSYKTIAIVEAEKTAVIMSIFMPCYIWMATGSKSGLKEDMLKPLKGRKILAYPDKSCFEDWNAKTKNLGKKGLDIVCGNFLEGTNLNDGEDLVDYMLSVFDLNFSD
ncbi:hypothetical protein ADIWIN_2454 [Winogradskyella psychrotolerans RS-3]|uniref:Uncharacterized protein n=1 Tax=Winogradskyella psychrotolerans RS-3 TaxID=641526 RepID=S7X0L7_9FLAO|nr:DUF6371 domain-containing protein [Winogradskyella psychrotolerans]EPR72564.1 hypothetical protein ADIWIN_2454 [Winogradskyella psychrotolerans RS-3]